MAATPAASNATKDASPTFTEGFFLSARDDDLLASGSRDPLGFEVIWVSFGRRVIPYLNTQSIGARNFATVTIMHWLVDRWMRSSGPRQQLDTPGQRRGHRRSCLLLTDTLLVYSTVSRSNQPDVDTDQLYGSQRAKRRWREREASPISVSTRREDLLLRGQFAAGHLGRYDAPLREMGVLLEDEDATDGTRVRHGWAERLSTVLEDQAWLEALESALREVYAAELEAPGSATLFSDFRADTELVRLRSHRDLAPLIHQIASVAGFVEVGDDPGPQAFLWRVLSEGVDQSGLAFKIAATKASESEETHLARRFSQILELEYVLARIEALFGTAWRREVPVSSRQRAFRELQDRAGVLARLREELLIDSASSSVALERIQRLRALISRAESHDAFRRALVSEYHRPIMKDERGKTPWLVVEDGEVSSLNEAYDPGELFRDGDGRAVSWYRRNYYFSSLVSFYNDYQRAVDEGGAR